MRKKKIIQRQQKIKEEKALSELTEDEKQVLVNHGIATMLSYVRSSIMELQEKLNTKIQFKYAVGLNEEDGRTIFIELPENVNSLNMVSEGLNES